MKQEIIEQMRNHVGSGRFAKSDFEADVKYVEDYDGMFFFLTRENGTSLVKIDPGYIIDQITDVFGNDSKSAERFRIFWFRDFYTFITGILYWADEGAEIYYYNGIELVQIDESKAKGIWSAMYSGLYESFKKKYSSEYKIADKKLPIRFKCGLSYAKEWLRKAEELGDTSLIDGLKRMRNYGRCAVNQEIDIFKDYSEGGFYFEEMVNGECIMNGGLLMTSNGNKRWSIHT